jgi:four helix bundle protein
MRCGRPERPGTDARPGSCDGADARNERKHAGMLRRRGHARGTIVAAACPAVAFLVQRRLSATPPPDEQSGGSPSLSEPQRNRTALSELDSVEIGIGFACATCVTLPHHSVVAWQRADDLFVVLHRVSRTFPAIERFELAAQLRRSAFSVPVNIVEGFGRQPGRDRLHFLQIASASLAEVGYCLHAAKRLEYLNETRYEELELQVRQTAAPLRGLIKTYGREHP